MSPFVTDAALYPAISHRTLYAISLVILPQFCEKPDPFLDSFILFASGRKKLAFQ